jgi:hypothetical protein
MVLTGEFWWNGNERRSVVLVGCTYMGVLVDSTNRGVLVGCY